MLEGLVPWSGGSVRTASTRESAWSRADSVPGALSDLATLRRYGGLLALVGACPRPASPRVAPSSLRLLLGPDLGLVGCGSPALANEARWLPRHLKAAQLRRASGGRAFGSQPGRSLQRPASPCGLVVSTQRPLMPEQFPKTNAPSNKGLERTRPAANGVTGPCRSTQCSTDVWWDQPSRGAA